MACHPYRFGVPSGPASSRDDRVDGALAHAEIAETLLRRRDDLSCVVVGRGSMGVMVPVVHDPAGR